MTIIAKKASKVSYEVDAQIRADVEELRPRCENRKMLLERGRWFVVLSLSNLRDGEFGSQLFRTRQYYGCIQGCGGVLGGCA